MPRQRLIALQSGGQRRLSRRALLVDLGAAGLGVTILGACAGSSESGTTAPATDAPAGSEAPPADVTSAPVATEAAPVDTAVASDGSEPPTSESVADDELRFQHVSLGFVSAYVLVRGSEAAIVDTGTADSRDAILEGMAALQVAPSMVRHIVLTHNHGDHVGGLANLEADLSAATVYAGAGDIARIQSSLTLQEVNDGDEVFGMGVIGTPGHTPGSISLFDTDSGLLVAGDALNGDGSGGLTGANADFSQDLDEAARSIEKLAALMPTTVAFGHGGPPVTDDVTAKLASL